MRNDENKSIAMWWRPSRASQTRWYVMHLLRRFRTARQWLQPREEILLAHGWTRSGLYRIGRLAYPYGWGIAWHPGWLDPRKKYVLDEVTGDIEIVLAEPKRTVRSTFRKR
ncbi:hypothetical protein DQK91_19040 [Oceanidesulfovibrio marinus]|uniref:Uncharacterized protein n=1 Tax=Oceanidesulfovibrio marinus TaxID=370038 RepID=A0A6P1ZDV6_9BACT|nr:hypothetical protein DQK91_19040 [Oceanidesulfovibrio marinus]